MVSPSGFYQLPFTQQADLLLQHGTFLQTRKERGLTVDLYELDDLLVEIFYEGKTGEPVSVTAGFTSDQLKMLGNLQPRLTLKRQTTYLQNGNRAA